MKILETILYFNHLLITFFIRLPAECIRLIIEKTKKGE